MVRTGGGFVTARECFDVSTIAHELESRLWIRITTTLAQGGNGFHRKYSRDPNDDIFLHCCRVVGCSSSIFNTGATPISHNYNPRVKILPPNLASPPNIDSFSL